MANDNHFSSATCYNVAMQKHNYYNEFFELGQQKINFNFYELHVFLEENGYDEKYRLGNARMFVIDGMDKVRDVIEKNRKRKLTKHKEFMLYAIGRNINKYHRFLCNRLQKFESKKEENIA